MATMSWIKQAYLCTIPAIPMGYLLIHGFRGDQFWTKFYVNRSTLPASDSLKQLVELEMDNMEDIRHSKAIISLTNELEPKLYGGFFLNNGVELQFPIKVSIEDVEQARRLGSNIEMDLGLAKNRRKIEANSPVGDELASRLMLSEKAKRFIIQRQLQLANNGINFSVPIIAWISLSTVGYFIFTGMTPIIGSAISFIATISLIVIVYRQAMRDFKAYITKKADEVAVTKGKDYLQGARDYFNSAMKFNRLIREVFGDEGTKNIEKNGDLKSDLIKYSERLKNIESIVKRRVDNDNEW